MGIIKLRGFASASLLALSSAAHVAWAQTEEFADDFSSNSIRYSIEIRADDPNSANAVNTVDGVALSVNSVNDTPSEVQIDILDQSQSININGRFDTENTSLNEGGWAQIGTGGAIFNDSNNGVIDSSSRFGDIAISVNSAAFSGGSTNLYVCLGREGENGYEDYPAFENGSNCKNYEQSIPAFGSAFELGYRISGSNEITLTLGTFTDTITLQGTLYAPNQPRRYIRLNTNSNAGTGSYTLSSVTLDSGPDIFTQTQPVLGRYTIYSDPGENPVRLEDERVRVAYQSEDEDYSGLNVYPLSISDYLEATLEFSSLSNIATSDDRIEAEIQSEVVNDTQDGGFDGRIGDIRAIINLSNRYNGLRRAEYCLYRYIDAAGDARDGLLNGGNNRCLEFPVRVEFDTPYRVAIDVDRVNSTITFRLNGFIHTESLSTPLFDAAESYTRISMGASNGGELLGFIDDVRNSKTALTQGEIATGANQATTFPPEPDANSLMVDSTLDAPFDFSKPATFVDDFSTDTTLLGFESWGDADSSITYTDGAVELQAHTNRDPADGGGATAFTITKPTDSIKVRAAVSSDSQVPAGNNADTSFDLEVVFHNDTADGGYQDRAGDIQAKIRVRFEGSGRTRVESELQRRDEADDSSRLSVFPDGEDRYDFNGFRPALDQPYDISIRLDRVQGAIVFSVDEEEISVMLNTEIFEPAERSVQIRAYHQGTSGRAAVRLYSIETDTDVINFAEGPPVIAPYRPSFEARQPGTDVGVENGRLKLSTDGRVANSSRTAQIRVRGTSDHVGADIELSSESVVGATGYAYVGVSGSLYADLDNGPDNSEGTVFAALRLQSTGDQGRYVEYCAFRSNDESFGSAAELIGGDPDNCPRFSITPELDTLYPASISLDESAMTLTYRFGEEEFVYNIATDITIDANQFNGIRARSSDDSMAVAYADNLAFAQDATPLAQSTDNFGNISANSSGGEETDGGSTDSSGGGGCSISGQSSNVLLPLMAIFAFIRLRRGKKR
jgi:hypothetical protein